MCLLIGTYALTIEVERDLVLRAWVARWLASDGWEFF